ncbi:uncharacterized protein HaLaN_00726 [Haematococcus lacustris]|uniref:DUF6816 domain-containing protein n=1 Tax=Haematococcus lacustris TaxID=44745 RepID=A0A699Y7K0_HAELA|nr:uncharacterized protein HaLaN_00726 [Haematococcus lacustris]
MGARVDTPLGPDMVPDQAVVERARREDLQRPVMYKVAFRTNSQGEVVYDRAFNTAAMLSSYYDRSPADFLQRIRWNPDDPNVLQLSMPDGLAVRTRVTRRLEDNPSPDRIETSEYLEQVFEDAEMAESQARASPSGTRLKASQCFTKYKYRSEASTAPGQPAIVATQRIGESRWRPLELCYWPEQGAPPAKGKEYPEYGYKRLRGKPPKAQRQQPAVTQ